MSICFRHSWLYDETFNVQLAKVSGRISSGTGAPRVHNALCRYYQLFPSLQYRLGGATHHLITTLLCAVKQVLLIKGDFKAKVL